MNCSLSVPSRQVPVKADEVRVRIESKLDELGLRLGTFPHHKLTGSNRFRLRVGDYRIIYAFDAAAGIIHLLAVGHRREIYRDL